MLASQTPLFFWRACLLVIPAGLDPRTYSIGTLHNRLQELTRFFIFVLNLTPAKSVEISIVSRYIIKINGKFENFTILFDIGVIGEIFINKSYTLQHNIFFHFVY